MVEVNGFPEFLSVDVKLHDAVIGRFGELTAELVIGGLGDRQGKVELIAGLGVSPPELRVATPLAGEWGHVLFLRVAAGLAEDLELLAFERAFDLEGLD